MYVRRRFIQELDDVWRWWCVCDCVW